ncbi:MAG: Hsp20/alpha crystallin family protein [Proteobacteria bacterium]|nr:Hsp20/alpha crystallin family protein [Pseudomonadota bacterium]MBU1738674.1 Hsp20/alpha crystallin family protein [Pseudomonadota bacterium]
MSEKKDIAKREETRPETTRPIDTVSPAVDIYENKNEILLHADMPGVAKEDIDVNIDNGKLTLVGLRKMATTGVGQWEEFGEVQYARTFSVPQTIDVGKVKAELKEGVLRLHLPKSEAAKPRQIEIKAA